MNEDLASNAPAHLGVPRRVSGDKARLLIEEQLAAHSAGIIAVLSQYRLADAVHTWLGTIRAIEEFINIPLFGVKDLNLTLWLRSVPLDHRFLSNPGGILSAIRKALSPYFELEVIRRYHQTVLQTAAMARAFRMNNHVALGRGMTLDTVGAAVDYFQSRRRHLVSLLYTMPLACTGAEILPPIDALNVLLPQAELSGVTITSLHLKLALLETVEDFSLVVDGAGLTASHWLETLDDYFLEPERASVLVMADLRRDQFVLPQLETLDPMKVFSAAELRNSTKLLGATYAAFGLNDSDFRAMTLLIMAFARYCRDDYFIEIGKQKFLAMLRAQSTLDADELERLLVNVSSDYASNTNAYEPFIDLGNTVVSNVNLLSRFLYAFKNIHLDSRRRFQVHAGFIFEEMVKQNIAGMGFHVTDIKRVNRKEFDVVATHGGVIYNFQCKNNWIDLAKVEAQRALYVRYNRTLTLYYERALEKEEKREHLLKQELGLDRIEHYVISRFPVISTNPRIINYNQIGKLSVIIGNAA